LHSTIGYKRLDYSCIITAFLPLKDQITLHNDVVGCLALCSSAVWA